MDDPSADTTRPRFKKTRQLMSWRPENDDATIKTRLQTRSLTSVFNSIYLNDPCLLSENIYLICDVHKHTLWLHLCWLLERAATAPFCLFHLHAKTKQEPAASNRRHESVYCFSPPLLPCRAHTASRLLHQNLYLCGVLLEK